MTDEPHSAGTDASYSSMWSYSQGTYYTDATAESPVSNAPTGGSSNRRATHHSTATPTQSMHEIIRTCQWFTEETTGAVYIKNSATGRKVALPRPGHPVLTTDLEGQLVPFSQPELDAWQGTDSLALYHLSTFQGELSRASGGGHAGDDVSKEDLKKLVKPIIETYTASWGGTHSIALHEAGHWTELSNLVLEAVSVSGVLRMYFGQ